MAHRRTSLTETSIIVTDGKGNKYCGIAPRCSASSLALLISRKFRKSSVVWKYLNYSLKKLSIVIDYSLSCL